MMSTNSRDNYNKKFNSNRRRNRGNRNKRNIPGPNTVAPLMNPRNSIYTFHRKSYYKILVGNYGVDELCKRVHKMLLFDYQDSDSSSDDCLSDLKRRGPKVDKLIYIMLICHVFRCYTLGVHLGYYQELDKHMSKVQHSMKNLKLPSILCDYIEAIGRVQLKNGIIAVPWFAPKDEFYSSDLAQLSPETVLKRAPKSDSSVNIDWLNSFDLMIFKPSNPILKLRSINWDNVNGGIEMIITKKLAKHDAMITSPQECLEVEAQRGSIYQFRRISEKSYWPTDTLKVCQEFFSSSDSYPYRILYNLNASKSDIICPVTYCNFSILVGNYGVEQLCKIVYNLLQMDGHCDLILDQLIYVVVICHFNRCKQLGFYNKDKYLNPSLPSVLCKYIETIGIFQLKSGITVKPWFDLREEFYSSKHGQLTPEKVLERAGRPIPNNSSCIDYEWLVDFENRMHRVNCYFPHWAVRKIDWDNKTGSIEMMITTKVDYEDEEAVIATSPQKCLVVQAQLGAIYNYRRFSEQSDWPGDTSKICQDFFRVPGFIPAEVFTILISK